MVTTIRGKVKGVFGDVYSVFIISLLFPLFFIFWVVSLFRGGMDNEEEWK